MEEIDIKSVDAVIVGIFKDANIETETENPESYEYAVKALLDADWEREAFGTDLSMYVDAAFSLGLRLAVHAVSDPLRIDYRETRAAIADAREQVDNFRAERADILTENGLRWLAKGREAQDARCTETASREPEPVA